MTNTVKGGLLDVESLSALLGESKSSEEFTAARSKKKYMRDASNRTLKLIKNKKISEILRISLDSETSSIGKRGNIVESFGNVSLNEMYDPDFLYNQTAGAVNHRKKRARRIRSMDEGNSNSYATFESIEDFVKNSKLISWEIYCTIDIAYRDSLDHFDLFYNDLFLKLFELSSHDKRFSGSNLRNIFLHLMKTEFYLPINIEECSHLIDFASRNIHALCTRITKLYLILRVSLIVSSNENNIDREHGKQSSICHQSKPSLDLGLEYKTEHVNQLQEELQAANSKIGEIEKKIESGVRWITSHHEIPNSKNAKYYCFKFAVEKMTKMVKSRRETAILGLFKRWKSLLSFYKHFHMIVLYSTIKCFHGLQRILTRLALKQLHLSFQRWLKSTVFVRNKKYLECCISIQKVARGYFVKAQIKVIFNAVKKIQMNVRVMQAKLIVRMKKTKLLHIHYATLIQAQLRKVLARQLACKVAKERRSAIIIQCLYRSLLSKKTVAEIRLENAVISYQSSFRSFIVRKELMKWRYAQFVLQKSWRNTSLRRKAIQQRRERKCHKTALLLQTNWRRRSSWKKYESIKNTRRISCKILQSAWRNHAKRRSAACVIQNWSVWRNLIKRRNAACIIQNWSAWKIQTKRRNTAAFVIQNWITTTLKDLNDRAARKIQEFVRLKLNIH